MAGRLIVLPGVSSGASNGGGRIDMTDADLIAARIPYLTHAVSARTLKVGSAGITGRCRATGELLVAAGSGGRFLTVKMLKGSQAIVNGEESSSGSLLLPYQSWRSSSCVVAVVYLGPESATQGLSNIINANQNEVYAASFIRAYGSGGSSNHSGNYVNTINTQGGEAAKVSFGQPNNWAVVVSYSDPRRGKAGIAINGGGFNVFESSNFVAPADERARLAIGYATASGLKDSGVGDVFVFSAPMLDTDYGQAAISTLVSALKSQYAIG